MPANLEAGRDTVAPSALGHAVHDGGGSADRRDCLHCETGSGRNLFQKRLKDVEAPPLCHHHYLLVERGEPLWSVLSHELCWTQHYQAVA